MKIELKNALFFRLRVPTASVVVTNTLTLCAFAVDAAHFTFRSRSVALARSLLPKCADVNNFTCLIESFVCVLLCYCVSLLSMFLVAWGRKALRRRTTGTGREKYLKDLPRRFKNGQCGFKIIICQPFVD